MEILIVFCWLIVAIVVGFVAAARGRSGPGFFLLSFFLSPIIGLLVLLLVRNYAEENRQWEVSRALQKIPADKALSYNPVKAQANDNPVVGAEDAERRLALIERLAALRMNGVLSDEEFQEQKRLLLSGEQTTHKAGACAPEPQTSKLTTLFGVCTTCRSTIDIESIVCPRCGASRAVNPNWKPRPL